MLNKLSSFYNNIIIKIQILIDTYYIFYKQPDILNYIIKLPKKDRFFHNNIKNINN